MIEANPRFRQKKTKKYTLAAHCQRQNATRIKLGPETCMYAHTPMHTAEIWKNIWIFLFPESILLIDRDNYIALYWRFCVRI